MKKKKCINPSCGKKYTPGHYGKKQRVCGNTLCTAWYKLYWSQVRKPPRGVSEAILAQIERECRSDVLRFTLLVVARETGLRKGEILGLTWEDVMEGNRAKSEVIVRGQWEDGIGFKPTKTRTSDIGLFSERARKAIDRLYASKKRRAEDRVFPLSESSVWKWFTKLQKSLGIKNPETKSPFRFHDLRHCVGVELVAAGRIDLAQKMLRHKSINSTMIYAQRSPSEILEDVERVRRHERKKNRKNPETPRSE